MRIFDYSLTNGLSNILNMVFKYGKKTEGGKTTTCDATNMTMSSKTANPF